MYTEGITKIAVPNKRNRDFACMHVCMYMCVYTYTHAYASNVHRGHHGGRKAQPEGDNQGEARARQKNEYRDAHKAKSLPQEQLDHKAAPR
jgi:hypothetical protein